ncbi:MAG: hypothetical protein ACI9K1_002792, partial [Arcticibacterium sp.]
MIFNPSRFLVLIGILLIQASCKRSKIQKSIADLPKVNFSKVDSTSLDQEVKLNIQESDFEYLKLKSKIDFRSENLSQSFPANVHIQKDSVIWISVS